MSLGHFYFIQSYFVDSLLYLIFVTSSLYFSLQVYLVTLAHGCYFVYSWVNVSVCYFWLFFCWIYFFSSSSFFLSFFSFSLFLQFTSHRIQDDILRKWTLTRNHIRTIVRAFLLFWLFITRAPPNGNEINHMHRWTIVVKVTISVFIIHWKYNDRKIRKFCVVDLWVPFF